MAEFILEPGLDEKVAAMVAPEVRDIAEQVKITAKRLAPAAKKWITMGDNLVRDTHRDAPSNGTIPANLRFKVRGTDWDTEHGLSAGVDYLLRPRDTTRLPADSVQHVHCRCHAPLLPSAIAQAVVTEPTQLLGPLVRVVVSCTYVQIVACEYGDSYPDGTTAEGTHFMGRAAARVAGNGGGYTGGAHQSSTGRVGGSAPGQGGGSQ